MKRSVWAVILACALRTAAYGIYAHDDERSENSAHTVFIHQEEPAPLAPGNPGPKKVSAAVRYIIAKGAQVHQRLLVGGVSEGPQQQILLELESLLKHRPSSELAFKVNACLRQAYQIPWCLPLAVEELILALEDLQRFCRTYENCLTYQGSTHVFEQNLARHMADVLGTVAVDAIHVYPWGLRLRVPQGHLLERYALPKSKPLWIAGRQISLQPLKNISKAAGSSEPYTVLYIMATQAEIDARHKKVVAHLQEHHSPNPFTGAPPRPSSFMPWFKNLIINNMQDLCARLDSPACAERLQLQMAIVRGRAEAAAQKHASLMRLVQRYAAREVVLLPSDAMSRCYRRAADVWVFLHEHKVAMPRGYVCPWFTPTYSSL